MADHNMPEDDIQKRGISLVGSPDVLATIGRPGLLDTRSGVSSVDRLPARDSEQLLSDLRNDVLRPGKVLITSLLPEIRGETPADQIVRNLEGVAEILARSQSQLFVFNVSTFDPNDDTHMFEAGHESYAVRSHRLLIELENAAAQTGINVIDIDGAVAEVGAVANVPEAGALAGDAIDFVTEEAVLAIDQSGALGDTIQAPVMSLRVPSFDRRTTEGTIASWLVQPGQLVSDGEALFDVRFETRVHRFDLAEDDRVNQRKKSGRSAKADRSYAMQVSVVAGAEAYVHEILCPEGHPVNAGDVAAIVTTGRGMDVTAGDVGADFRVGARVIES